MKKFYGIILSVMLLVGGLLMSACNEEKPLTLTLSKDAVVIYYNITENNTETVNVKVDGGSVSALGLRYDNTNIRITSKKKDDASFDLFITPKTKISTDEISVQITAGGVANAWLTVAVVVPVERINASDDQYIVFKGEDTSYNLRSNLTFLPTGVGTPALRYEILNEEDFSDWLIIESNTLFVSGEFDNFEDRIHVRATVVDNMLLNPANDYFLSQEHNHL